MQTAKESVRDTIDHLPDQAGWDDIVYGLCVKRKIEERLADVEAGRTVSHERINAGFRAGLPVASAGSGRHSRESGNP